MSALHGSRAGTSAGCGCGCAGGGSVGENRGCGGSWGSDVELTADPFTALRVTYGMLLGEADFEVLMGNPRGKGMLHAAWLHGSGLVWGLGVTWTPPAAGQSAGGSLRVDPGLAVDGWGRELRLDAARCLDLRAWALDRVRRDPDPVDACSEVAPGEGGRDCRRRTLEGWVVAEFATCLDNPVPALADPCDVTRQHDMCSRVVETLQLTVRETAPQPAPDHPRVRALVGLTCETPDPRERPACGSPACTDPGHAPAAVTDPQVSAALAAVSEASAGDRACVLQRELRRLAALDSQELAPAVEEGDVGGLYPVTEEDAGVVLARLRVLLTVDGDCVRVDKAEVDVTGRRALLPTATLQDLIAAAAPGLISGAGGQDAGGPRLVDGSLGWSDHGTRLEFRLTAAAVVGSLENAVEVTSLSAENGWAHDEVAGISLHDQGRRVVVHLDQPPAYPTVRVRIRGTGPTPIVGRYPPAPFAGIEHGPPGTPHEGHDAVFMTRLPRSEDRDDGRNDDDNAGRDRP